jgi:hypothetical protein
MLSFMMTEQELGEKSEVSDERARLNEGALIVGSTILSQLERHRTTNMCGKHGDYRISINYSSLLDRVVRTDETWTQ